ncbi:MULTISPECIES: recombination mediator RecR [Spongiibacter]|uniref:recombination mediator RecR n=1 Tax=Spongiibacter TaxID=630749 RepID=UPI000C600D14|nr:MULTISPECIES: recombination mediator RecR [Spongiibacter]MAY40269.1 recombination protein RecR [Spongiibacter sp.]MBO6752916.1 recombination protein RecR [Spongiibacter sp.]MBU73621.1 recombination protein RecR [Spongiibacter sp.]|tara:strand:+ start:41886 stop:42488 length:603 start_codon:yes stop_codon:yes gene_type:complete
MANFSPLIDELIEALRCLPGVGPKSAQRISFQLLERNRGGAQRLSLALQKAVDEVGHCRSCRTLTEDTECRICRDPRRDQQTICVVESPADVLAFEQGGDYRGLYFVLMGRLSPIDGIGPEEIGIDRLVERVQALSVKELILATNPTVEGEATAFYIAEEMRRLGVAVSRIAHGVPLGGELEYVDSGTLSHALKGRQRFD